MRYETWNKNSTVFDAISSSARSFYAGFDTFWKMNFFLSLWALLSGAWMTDPHGTNCSLLCDPDTNENFLFRRKHQRPNIWFIISAPAPEANPANQTSKCVIRRSMSLGRLTCSFCYSTIIMALQHPITPLETFEWKDHPSLSQQSHSNRHFFEIGS